MKKELPFSERSISVTMLGKQWFALLAKAVNRPLSAEGAKCYHEAAKILQETLTKDS